MDGVVAVDEHNLWLHNHFKNVVAKNKNIGVKVYEMKEKISELKEELHNILRLHDKILKACCVLDFVANSFKKANQDLKRGNISKLKEEWQKLKTSPEDEDGSPVTVLITSIQQINIETDQSEEHTQSVGSNSQQGDSLSEKKKLLEEEIYWASKITPILTSFEADLRKSVEFVCGERDKLEESAKKTLASLARIKLDLSKFENECSRLKNILQKHSSAHSLSNQEEKNKMLSETKEIEKSHADMICQWQENHDKLCGVLEDVRYFEAQSAKTYERLWFLCKWCCQQNTERLECIYQLKVKMLQGQK